MNKPKTTAPQPSTVLADIHPNTYLRPDEIAKSRRFDPLRDPPPRISVTVEKLYKDVRAGILPKPKKIGAASLFRWGDICEAYGLEG